MGRFKKFILREIGEFQDYFNPKFWQGDLLGYLKQNPQEAKVLNPDGLLHGSNRVTFVFATTDDGNRELFTDTEGFTHQQMMRGRGRENPAERIKKAVYNNPNIDDTKVSRKTALSQGGKLLGRVADWTSGGWSKPRRIVSFWNDNHSDYGSALTAALRGLLKKKMVDANTIVVTPVHGAMSMEEALGGKVNPQKHRLFDPGQAHVLPAGSPDGRLARQERGMREIPRISVSSVASDIAKQMPMKTPEERDERIRMYYLGQHAMKK